MLSNLAGPIQHFRSAVLDAWRNKVAVDLCGRKGFRGGPLLDIDGSLQLLNSSHVRERDKGLLRSVMVGGVWNVFLLGRVRNQTVPCRFCGAPDHDGHLFWECTFPPLVEIREHPEFHDLMRMDKAHWPRCLLWHGWLPMLSGCNGVSPWAGTASESAHYLVETALGGYSSRLVSDWSLPDGYDPVAVSCIVPDYPNVWTDGRLLVFPPLVLVSLLIILPLFGMFVPGGRLIFFTLLIVSRLVEVSALFLGFVSRFRGLRCGVLFWLYSLLVLFTWVLTILELFVMLVVCWTVDKSRGSKSVEVQRVWEVYDERLQKMSCQDAFHLDESLASGDVSRAWLVWSGAAEVALADAYRFPGGPVPSRGLVLGRGRAQFQVVRLGRSKVRKARGDVSDVGDAAGVFLYRDSSIARLLDMRRRFSAVLCVLDAMLRWGVSLARSVELASQWDKVLAIGPSYPITDCDLAAVRGLGIGGFYEVVSGLHRRLCDFIHAVVVHRRDDAIRGWRNWVREDPLVHPYKWLRPDFVPPGPFLHCEPHLTPGGSGVISDPGRIDEEFRKAWLPHFCRSGKGRPALTNSILRLLGGCLSYLKFIFLG